MLVISCCQPLSVCSPNLQSHLKSMALFFPFKEPIPNPPLFVSVATICQATLQILLSVDTPIYKNIH